MKLFERITWPESATYNITPTSGAKSAGSAEIEVIKRDELDEPVRIAHRPVDDSLKRLA